MNDKLTTFEEKAINMFADFNKTFRRVLEKQLKTAKIRRELLASAYIVIFDVAKNTETLRTSRRVPMEIVVDPQFTETRVIRCHKKPAYLRISEDAIGLQLHFQEGRLIELEIYSVSCKKLQVDICNSSKAIYLIYDDDFYPSA